jgi:hypothetical protein
LTHHPLAAPILLSFTFLVPATALAQEAPSPDPKTSLVDRLHPGFGLRVGGYDFRAQDGTYTDCPMGGVGLFADADVARYFYVEGAVDSYSLTRTAETAGMDRVSAMATVAGGVRFFPDFYVVPHLVAGAGLEWTRVEELGARLTGVYPLAFLGVGAELNVLKHLKGGADLRLLGMAQPYLDTAGPTTLRMEAQPASQALFYVRYVL